MPFLAIPFPAIDPVLLRIGPFALRWYALAYIAGILIGWFYARAMIRTPRLWGGPAPLTVADYDDFILWVTLGIILGGRLGFILFYNAPYFLSHPLDIFKLWEGGMSFHGGFTGCVLAVVLFARHRGIPILPVGDLTCAVGPIGLFLGRLANFINGELWGRPTDVPWAMVFPGGGPLPRHPSQLYEASPGGAVAAGHSRRPHPARRAQTPRLDHRSVRHRLRDPALVLANSSANPIAQLGFLWGGMTMGMLLSIPLFLAGVGFIWNALRSPPLHQPEPG